jgi:hypothetical protein
MRVGRYLVAIAVGLAIGMAVGWYSGRSHQAAPRVALRHHTGRAVNNVRPEQHQPKGSRPAPRTPARPPSLEQLQQQLLQCVFGHPTPAGQTACLRSVVRRAVRAAGPEWRPPGGAPPVLPFASISPD